MHSRGHKDPNGDDIIDNLSDEDIDKILEKYGKDAAPYVGEYVKEMKEAVSKA